MLAAVIIFAVGTGILFILSCGRFPFGSSDSESTQQPQQLQRQILLPSKRAAKTRFVCDDDLNEITNSNRQYSGGLYV